MKLYPTTKVLCVMAVMATTARAQDAGSFTLFDDYGCPSAAPMEQVDGGWLASDARKARIDCALLGAQGELDQWRPNKQVAPPAQSSGFVLLPSHGVLAVLSSAVTAYLAIVTSRAGKGCKAVMNPFGGC